MKFKTLAVLMILTLVAYNFAYAHSGRTDKYGCHEDTRTGTRH